LVWTHNACLACYEALYPGREPVVLRNPRTETCCFCGQSTTSGIYVRYNPKELSCKHEEELA
jgi:hypothetical protein